MKLNEDTYMMVVDEITDFLFERMGQDIVFKRVPDGFVLTLNNGKVIKAVTPTYVEEAEDA